MNHVFALSALIAFTASLNAQQGKIVEQLIYQYPDSSLAILTARDTGFLTMQTKTELKAVTYLSDGLKIKGYLIQPKASGKYPCIILCRGGSSLNSPPFDAADIAQMQTFASWGYVVLGTQYRGSIGSEERDEYGGADVNDVLNAAYLFDQVPNADTSSIGLYGFSRGGMMVYLALKKSKRFKAAVVNSGVANIFTHLALRPDAASLEKKVYATHIPDYITNKEAELKKRSAVFWADSLSKSTPILIMQGSADWRVNTEETLELLEKFFKAKQPVKYILFPGAVHGLFGEYRREMHENIKLWFDDYLKKKKPLPNMEKHGR
ncbi:MAG: alpha/beta hydrolase family protein [Chitinophagaceae bacterium]